VTKHVTITPNAVKAAEQINEFCNALHMSSGDVIAALCITLGAGVYANGVDRAAVLAILQKALSAESQAELARLWREHVS
jgi:hypothetical protein